MVTTRTMLMLAAALSLSAQDRPKDDRALENELQGKQQEVALKLNEIQSSPAMQMQRDRLERDLKRFAESPETRQQRERLELDITALTNSASFQMQKAKLEQDVRTMVTSRGDRK